MTRYAYEIRRIPLVHVGDQLAPDVHRAVVLDAGCLDHPNAGTAGILRRQLEHLAARDTGPARIEVHWRGRAPGGSLARLLQGLQRDVS